MADFPDDLVKGRMGDRGGEKFNATAFRQTADTNITASIQRAIDKAFAADGGVVSVPSHTNDTLGAFEIPSGVALELPKTARLTAAEDATLPLITATGLSGPAIFGGGVIDGNGLGELYTGAKLIHLIDCTDVRIDGLRTKNALGSGIFLENCQGVTLHDFRGIDTEAGIWGHECSDVRIVSPRLYRSGMPGDATTNAIRGIRFTRSQDVSVLDPYIDGFDMGVEPWAGGFANLENGCHNFKIIGGHIWSPWPLSFDCSYDVSAVGTFLGGREGWELFILGIECAGAQRARFTDIEIIIPASAVTGPRIGWDTGGSGTIAPGDGAHGAKFKNVKCVGGKWGFVHFQGDDVTEEDCEYRDQSEFAILHNPQVDEDDVVLDTSTCDNLQLKGGRVIGAGLRGVQARLVHGEIKGKRISRCGGSAIYHIGVGNAGARVDIRDNTAIDNCLTNPFGVGADGGIMVNGVLAGTRIDLFDNTSGAELNNGQGDQVFGTIEGEVRSDWRVETPVTMETGTTTPSVALGRIFDIYSPTPRTLSNFLGGYTGKEFWARFIDDNTTLGFAGSTLLRGRFVDRTFVAGQWIHGWWNVDGWEISSSDAAETDEPNTWTKPQNHVTSAGTNAVIVAGVTGDTTNRLQIAPDYIAMGDGGVGGADAVLSRIAAGQYGIGGARIATQAAALANTLPSSISNPPTQAEVQAILDVLAELLPKMQTAGSLG